MKKIGRQVFIWGIVTCLFMGNAIQTYAEEYEYDELNRVTKVLYEDGSYVEYEYDSNGNILSVEVYQASKELPNDKEEENTEESEEDKESTEAPKDEVTDSETKEEQEESTESEEEPEDAAESEEGIKDSESTVEKNSEESIEESTDATEDSEEAAQHETPQENILQKIWKAIKSFLSKLVQWISSWFA